MIIGSPKSLSEVPVFSKLEIEELVAGSTEMLKQGIPGEVPAAVPVKHLLRLTATLEKYRAVLIKLTEAKDAEDEKKESMLSEAMDSAQELIDAEQPKAVQPVQSAPKSRLVVPK